MILLDTDHLKVLINRRDSRHFDLVNRIGEAHDRFWKFFLGERQTDVS